MRDMGPGNMQPIRIDGHTLVRYWLISPFTCTVLAALILVAFWYFQAAGDLAERGRPWPPQRTLAFCGGLLAIELAVQSSVAMLPYISFPMHVVQILLLVVVAPPLLVLGTPVALALETAGPRPRRRLLAATGSAPARVLLHPAVSFVLLSVGLLAYFLTAALAGSMRHVWLLNLINLGFLMVGLLFWWAALGADAVPAVEVSAGHRLVLLAGAIGLESVLGIALLVRTKPVAAMYTLTGTRQGGAIWWVVAMLATFAALIAVFAEWNRGDELLGPADGPELASPAEGQWPASARLSPPG